MGRGPRRAEKSRSRVTLAWKGMGWLGYWAARTSWVARRSGRWVFQAWRQGSWMKAGVEVGAGEATGGGEGAELVVGEVAGGTG